MIFAENAASTGRDDLLTDLSADFNTAMRVTIENNGRKIGLVETAGGGTLFLDEIGDLDLPLQVKLLRLLEERSVRRVGGLRDQSVDVRIVAATHRDLETMVMDGRFRADLYFRIRMVHLAIPALRERGDDIPLLADHFLALHARRYGKEGLVMSAAVRQALRSHRWPGNVRELRNIMEQAVLMASGTVVESLEFGRLDDCGAGAPTPAGSSSLNLEEVERSTIARALESARWNVSQAARVLGVTRDALRYRMDKHGLSVAE